ncbi:MAG: TIGR00266 family protein [Leptospiraceae bacterium]|nr:TIGR00266 family protein [Leptospiraceae bacterium]
MVDKEKKEYEQEILCKPDFAFLNVKIPSGKTVRVEASAMASMDTNVKMKTKFKGGFKRLLSGESLFINEFTAENGDGEINIAPGSPGDLEHVYLDNETIYLQGSAYVASGMQIETDTKWQGFKKGFFSGQSMFLIKCTGVGDLWFNAYGGIIELDVDGDYVVDTGYIVAFTEGLEYDVTSVGGYKSLFFSGEGLVCRFKGQGKVWIQTRQASSLAHFLQPFRPVERRSSGG